MDTQQLVLSKIVITRDLAPIFDAKITEAFFPDPRAREVFEVITDHRARYGEVPPHIRLASACPNYEFVVVEEGWEPLIDDLREMRAVAILEDGLRRAVDELDNGSRLVRETMARAIAQVEIEVSSSRELVWQEDIEERIATYRGYADNQGLKGIPSGFETIDKATQGFQPGQLVTFAGPPKAGKTTLILLAAYAALLAGHKVLFFSFEMGGAELFEILDAIHAKVSISLLRSGGLHPSVRDRLERMLRELPENIEARLTVVEDPDSATNMSAVDAKVIQHQPALTLVDGIYLLEDERSGEKGSPRALRNITQASKLLAKRRQIPFVITTQINEHRVGKEGINQSSVFGSQSYAQDSDVLLGLEPTTDDPTISKLKILAARQAARVEVYVELNREKSIFRELDYDPTVADDDAFDGALAA